MKVFGSGKAVIRQCLNGWLIVFFVIRSTTGVKDY